MLCEVDRQLQLAELPSVTPHFRPFVERLRLLLCRTSIPSTFGRGPHGVSRVLSSSLLNERPADLGCFSKLKNLPRSFPNFTGRLALPRTLRSGLLTVGSVPSTACTRGTAITRMGSSISTARGQFCDKTFRSRKSWLGFRRLIRWQGHAKMKFDDSNPFAPPPPTSPTCRGRY